MSGHDSSAPSFEFVATTRRRWKREQKLAILAEIEASGGSVSEVARRHNLHTSLLFRWRRDLAGRSQGQANAAAPSPTFVPVALPAPEPPMVAAPLKPGTIEVAIVGGRTMRVSADVDTAALVRTIDALESAR